MKKIIALVATLILSIGCVFGLVGCGEEKVIGVDIYMMQLVAEELDMKIDVHDVDFDSICGKVATEDNAIGAAGITITDARKESVAFSNPYYSSVQCIISKNTENFTDVSSLKGKTIGVQKGTTGALMIQDEIDKGVLKDSGATLIEYETGPVAYTAMNSGKCEYVVLDKLPSQKLVLGSDKYVSKEITGVEVEEYGYCVGLNASKKDVILAAFNKVIANNDIDAIVAYFTAISNGEEPKTTIKEVNLDDNKGGTLNIYTCSGFEPYEFIEG